MTRQQEGDEAAEKESLAQELADAAMSIFMPEGDRRAKDEDPGYKHSFNQAKKRFGTILRNRSKLPTPEETTLPAMDEEINLKHEIQFPGMAGLPYRVVYNGNSLMSICSDADKVVVALPPAIPEGRHTYFQAEESEGKSMQFMVYAANRHHALTYALKAITAERDALKAEVRTLRLACGLVLSLHGCGGDNCTEEAYLKDAEDMFTKLHSLRTQLDAVVGQETPKDAFERGQLDMRKRFVDPIRFRNYRTVPYTPPLKAGTE